MSNIKGSNGKPRNRWLYEQYPKLIIIKEKHSTHETLINSFDGLKKFSLELLQRRLPEFPKIEELTPNDFDSYFQNQTSMTLEDFHQLCETLEKYKHNVFFQFQGRNFSFDEEALSFIKKRFISLIREDNIILKAHEAVNTMNGLMAHQVIQCRSEMGYQYEAVEYIDLSDIYD